MAVLLRGGRRPARILSCPPPARGARGISGPRPRTVARSDRGRTTGAAGDAPPRLSHPDRRSRRMRTPIDRRRFLHAAAALAAGGPALAAERKGPKLKK